MSETSPTAEPSPRGRRLPKLLAGVVLVVAAGAAFWHFQGRKIWEEYKVLQTEVRASQDSAPVGYIGLNYRRGYNDRPLAFLTEADGKKRLFAAKLESGQVDTYDVTEADPSFDPNCLEGGFGRDSIPGIDYPIIETPGKEQAHALRDRQPVFGVTLGSESRAYPKDLLEKIEVVNDELGGTRLVVVYDRARATASLHDRKLRDGVVTFGTTGYSCKNRPVLYDRKTKGLWLVQGENLVCVSGVHKGESLAPIAKPGSPTWAQWSQGNRSTTVVVGNDRKKPIPTE